MTDSPDQRPAKLQVDACADLAAFEKRMATTQPQLDQRFLRLVQWEQDNPGQTFYVPGYSITANKPVKFLVDWQYSDGNHINWRERLVCPETDLCNRFRASYHIIKEYLQATPDNNIYITEQVTPLFKHLKTEFPNIVGSEFIDQSHTSGTINDQGIRHEDLTQLSFQSNHLDLICSFDCLEHVVDYQGALKECLRTLKSGGQVFMTFPFAKGEYANQVRAIINKDGAIEHLMEPDYHGDPLSDKGCLSFYTFGWELLDQMRDLGFKNVRAIHYWSEEYGYLGEEQIAIIGEKSKATAIKHAITGLWSRIKSKLF